LQTLDADDSMLHSIILILKRAINNQTWASINWQLPSPLNALALLTVNRHNVQALSSKAELPDLLVKVFEYWRRQQGILTRRSHSTQLMITPIDLALCLVTTVQLVRHAAARRQLTLRGLPSMLHEVANRTCGGGNGGCKLVSSELWVLRPRHLALLMATHNRLGCDPKCWLSNLDNCILKMIVDMASTDTGVGARALAQVMEEETLQEQEGGAAASQYLLHEGGAAGPSGRQRRSPRGKAAMSASATSPSAGASRRRRISRTGRSAGQDK